MVDWFDEIFDEIFNDNDSEQNKRTIAHKQLNKILSFVDLNKVKNFAKEVKIVPNDSIYIGGEMASYGDWSYYITPEGNIVCTYFDIGD